MDRNPSNSMEFMARVTTGGTTTFVASKAQALPAWVRLTRTGSQVTGSVSSDGVTWRTVGTVTWAIASPVFIGLIVTSHDATVLNASIFDNVAVSSLATPPTPPAAPASPSPTDGASGVSATPTLTWSSSGATTYDVAFGTTNPPPPVATGQPANSYSPSTVTASTTYFWQVVAHNASGTTTGPVWWFSTTAPAPGAPTAPNPLDAATGVSTTPTLTWNASGATSYDVRFGTAN